MRKIALFSMIVALLVTSMPMEAQRKTTKRKQKPINTLHYVGPYMGAGYSLLWHSIPDTRLYGGGTGMLGVQYFLRTPKKQFTFSASLEAMYLTSISAMDNFSIMGQYYYNDPIHQDWLTDYQLGFSDYRELHHQLSVNLPLMVGKEFKRAYFGVGANLRANLLGKYNTAALLTTSIIDPEIIGNIGNLPTHNLTNIPQKSKGNISFGLDLMAMAEVGLILDQWMPSKVTEYGPNAMNKKAISYRLGLFAACGVLSINNNPREQALIHFNNGQLQENGDIIVQNQHITDIYHNSMLASNNSVDKALHSLVVGAKFSVLFQMNKAKYRKKKAKKKTTTTTTAKPTSTAKVQNTIPFLLLDEENNSPIEAPIVVTQVDNNSQNTYNTNLDGCVNIPMDKDKEYIIQVGKTGYMGYHDTISQSTTDTVYIAMIPLKKNDVIILENLFFDTNKTTIKNTSTASLEELYNALKNNPDIHILIIGHTDNVGTDTYNQQLSEGRAKAVRNEMIRRGIKPDRIQWKGMGEKMPITTNTTEEGRATNRRVEIKIL